MVRIREKDWQEVERWVEEDLLEDEDEREAYRRTRAVLRKTKEEDTMELEQKQEQITEQPREVVPEPGRDIKSKRRVKQLAFDCGDELREKVRAYCGSNHIPIGEFCRKAIEAALETAPMGVTETVDETAEQEQSEETSVVAPATPTRGLILDIARQIVCADRNDTYGSAEDNFGIIAELWKPYLKGRGIAADNLTSMDVAILMIQLKVARVATGKFKLDNFVDICGYAACGGECGGRHD